MKIKQLSILGACYLALLCSSAFGASITCKQGFVWREATPADHTCVTVEERDTANVQNRNAQANRNPKGGAYGNDTCKQGFVWRETSKNDHVCVTSAERDEAKSQNEQHCERAATKCKSKK
jgi:hypothetical protein